MALSLLTPAPYNPRKDLRPGDPEYDRIKRSIEEFGLVEPLIWNERTRHLVGGHQRLKVLLDLGCSEAEVSVVDLDEAREKVLNVALNKVQGEWDMPLLADLLEDLGDADLDVSLTGFDLPEIEDLLAELREGPEVEEDEVPELPAVPVTGLGDLWLLGGGAPPPLRGRDGRGRHGASAGRGQARPLRDRPAVRGGV